GEAPRAGRVPRHQRHRRVDPLRDHRRVADPEPRRAPSGRRARDPGGPPPPPGRGGAPAPPPGRRRPGRRRAPARAAAPAPGAGAGAAGALVVHPYHNKPTREGLYRHFRAVAESVSIPILVYNIQGRTAINVETDTMARLARDVKNVVGVKEASGSLDQMSQVIAAGVPDVAVLSVDGNISLPVLAICR